MVIVLSSLFALSPWIILLILAIFIIGTIILLTIIENIFRKKLNLSKIQEENIYNRRVNNIKRSNKNPTEKLIDIDIVAKDFFKEIFNIKDYSYFEISEKLREKNKLKAVQFCKKMMEIKYSGIKTNSNILNSIIESLKILISDEKIISKEKEDEKKKNQNIINQSRGIINLMKLYYLKKKRMGEVKREKEKIEVEKKEIEYEKRVIEIEKETLEKEKIERQKRIIEKERIENEKRNIREEKEKIEQQKLNIEKERREKEMEMEKERLRIINLRRKAIKNKIQKKISTVFIGINEHLKRNKVALRKVERKMEHEFVHEKKTIQPKPKINLIKGIGNYFNFKKQITKKSEINKYVPYKNEELELKPRKIKIIVPEIEEIKYRKRSRKIGDDFVHKVNDLERIKERMKERKELFNPPKPTNSFN